MTALSWAGAIALGIVPIAVHLLVMARSRYLRMQMSGWLLTILASALAVLPVRLVERWLEAWAQIDPVVGTGGQISLLIYAFLIVAPLEMSLLTLAALPFWRLRRLRMQAGLARLLETREGVSFSVSAAVGFASVRNLFYLSSTGGDPLSFLRAGLWVVTIVFLCALWGYVLGRNAARGMSGKRFRSAWVAATIFSAAADQLIFRHGMVALAAVGPLLATMALVAWVLWREVHAGSASSGSGGRLSAIFSAAPAPSLHAIREAFHRQDRPLTLRWVVFGALVTTGMITAGLVAAIAVGHRVGIDFGVVDRQSAGAAAMAPLALLGSGAMAAFPAAGYLLARASGARSVLEPAIATALALVLVMVFMGMLAPLSVVFAIAMSPIAFGLSCVGAWVGLGH